MQPLDLPAFDFRLQKKEKKPYIFDIIRKKYVCLTPEEWVRQHFLHYLINTLGYPKSLIKLESRVGFQQSRTDIVVYNRMILPLMIVECKAPHVAVSHMVFDQAARYNSMLKAQLLVVTNGLKHFCCKVDYKTSKYQFLKIIPCFSAEKDK